MANRASISNPFGREQARWWVNCLLDSLDYLVSKDAIA